MRADVTGRRGSRRRRRRFRGFAVHIVQPLTRRIVADRSVAASVYRSLMLVLEIVPTPDGLVLFTRLWTKIATNKRIRMVRSVRWRILCRLPFVPYLVA